jgi:hypothetical protein
MRAIVSALALLASTSSFAITAEELIQKNIENRGGMAAIKALQNTTATGKSTFGGGDFSIDLAVKMVATRDSQTRLEATFQGMTLVNAFDGKESWTISPFQGRKDPQRNGADEAKAAKIGADFDGVLIDYKEKGYSVEYLGTEDVDGTDAHKLRVKVNATDSRTVFLDPDYFLEIMIEDRIQIRGAETVSRTELGDYEKVNGVFLPFYMKANGQKTNFDKIEANSTIDPAQFAFPTSAKK